MKKIIYSAFAVVLSVFLLSGCKSTNVEKDIVGKWKVTKVDMTNLQEMVTQMAQQLGLPDSALDQMKSQMKSDMDKNFEDAYMEFNEDHTLNMGDSDSYTWNYDKDNNKIIIKDNSGKTMDFIVKSLKGKNLDATMSFGQNGVTFDLDLKMEKE